MMYWVKATRVHDGNIIYINLERFDRIEVVTDENGKSFTLLSTILSTTEEDSVEVEIRESPEEIIPVAEN